MKFLSLCLISVLLATVAVGAPADPHAPVLSIEAPGHSHDGHDHSHEGHGHEGAKPSESPVPSAPSKPSDAPVPSAPNKPSDAPVPSAPQKEPAAGHDHAGHDHQHSDHDHKHEGHDHSHSGHGHGNPLEKKLQTPSKADIVVPPTPLSENDKTLLTSLDAAKLTSYCAKSNASAPCSLRRICESSNIKLESLPSCGTTAIGYGVCFVDRSNTKESEGLCADVKTTCGNDGEKCRKFWWPSFGSSMQFQQGIFGSCESHAKHGQTMKGCDQCPKPAQFVSDPAQFTGNWSQLAPCDSLRVFASMCNDMPKMADCAMWRNMCVDMPETGTIIPVLCDKEAMKAAKLQFSGPTTPAASPTPTSANNDRNKTNGSSMGAPISMAALLLALLALLAMMNL
jgi:hypothetical protein